MTELAQRNVVGGVLQPCSTDPVTGYYRTGCCETGPDDLGVHVVCAVMTESFLEFSVGHGNDLVTPVSQHGFPGLRPGDQWCLCATRWREALLAGAAPLVVLSATHERVLDFVTIEQLLAHEAPVG